MTNGFDWVRARAACSIAKIFKELELGTQNDVDAINSQRPEGVHIKFSVSKVSGDHFSVVREATNFPPIYAVDFALSEDEIHVEGDERINVDFVATLTLTNKGECRLRVGSEELEQWQVRRKALEQLFFGPYAR